MRIQGRHVYRDTCSSAYSADAALFGCTNKDVQGKSACIHTLDSPWGPSIQYMDACMQGKDRDTFSNTYSADAGVCMHAGKSACIHT